MKNTPLMAMEFLITGITSNATQDWKPILIQVIILILFQILKYLKWLNSRNKPTNDEPKIKGIVQFLRNLKQKKNVNN